MYACEEQEQEQYVKTEGADRHPLMASYLSMNGRDGTVDDHHYSLEPDLGTSSCSYESVVSPSCADQMLCTVQQQKSLRDRQRLALEFVEQSSGCHEESNLSDVATMAAIHADLKLEMGALSSWVSEVGGQFSTDDFDDHHRGTFRGSNGSILGRTRTRECNGRLSFIAPHDHHHQQEQQQQLNSSSLFKFPRGGSSQQVFLQPFKSSGAFQVMNSFSNHHHQQQQQPLQQQQYHEARLESMQQLQQIQIPGQFSSFDDTTVTMGLPSFGSSSGDQSEDSLIIDPWDGGVSPPSEKRQRLMSHSPVHQSPSMIPHHPPVGLSSMGDSLPSSHGRLDDGAVESALTSGSYEGGVSLGVDEKVVNEIHAGPFNLGQPRLAPPPFTHQQQQQELLASDFPMAGNSKSISCPPESSGGPTIHSVPSPLLENQVRISLPNGVSRESRLSSMSSRGLEDGWPSSPGISLKGLSSLGASHDANTMEQLLVHCAHSLEKNDVNAAHQVMWVLNNIVTGDGDPNERVTSCFLKALVRRAGRMVPSFNAMYGEERVSKTVSAVEYAVMVDITPWYRFGFKAANGAMLEAFEGKDRVHIIDFTTTYGMQWPTLIEALSSRPEGPPHVRLTVHSTRPNVAPYLGMSQEDVTNRLIMFAATKNVELEVTMISREIELLDRSMFDIRDDEVTIANCMYRARFIPDESAAASVGSSQCAHRDNFLKMVHSLNPALVTLVDEEVNVTSPSLVTRLKAAFNYLWIPFDSLDTFLPRDSPQRLDYELVLAKKIENIIVSEGLDRIERMETKGKWGQRMKKAGFELVPFSEDVSEEVKIMLSDHAAGWGMKQDEDAMLLTWKGHNVLFATSWRPSL